MKNAIVKNTAAMNGHFNTSSNLPAARKDEKANRQRRLRCSARAAIQDSMEEAEFVLPQVWAEDVEAAERSAYVAVEEAWEAHLRYQKEMEVA